METVKDFIILGSKITVNSDCSHKVKTHAPWKKSYHQPAATAKSLQSCPTLCDPIDSSPPGSAILGILQARTLEWVAISFSNAWKWKLKVKSLSPVQLLMTPWTAAYQTLPSMGFSRQEYWSVVLLPSLDQPRQHIKKQRHYFANKGPSNQSYVFSSNHVWMWELDYKESWAQKNWCFWTVPVSICALSPFILCIC